MVIFCNSQHCYNNEQRCNVGAKGERESKRGTTEGGGRRDRGRDREGRVGEKDDDDDAMILMAAIG